MKKVLFLTRPMVPPWHEGSKKLVWHIASGLREHEGHLLTTKTAVPPTASAAVQWHSIYTNPNLDSWQKFRLLRLIYGRLPEIDLLHCYFVPSLQTSRFLAASRRRHQLPMVQTVPSIPFDSLSPNEASRLYFGNRVVVYSAESANKLRRWGVSQVRQINVGVDLQKYVRTVRETAVRQQFTADEDAVLILFSGEYTRLGAIDRLRRIMPKLLAQRPNVHFLFACRLLLPTDAPIKASLQQEVAEWGMAERIHFVGEVPNFASLLKAADIFVFPVSDMRGKIETPLTLIEAMAAGLPVVTTDIAPLNEMIPPEAGWLFPPDRDEPTIAGLGQLADSATQRHALGAAGQKFVLPRYGVAQMVQAYEDIYAELA